MTWTRPVALSSLVAALISVASVTASPAAAQDVRRLVVGGGEALRADIRAAARPAVELESGRGVDAQVQAAVSAIDGLRGRTWTISVDHAPVGARIRLAIQPSAGFSVHTAVQEVPSSGRVEFQVSIADARALVTRTGGLVEFELSAAVVDGSSVVGQGFSVASCVQVVVLRTELGVDRPAESLFAARLLLLEYDRAAVRVEYSGTEIRIRRLPGYERTRVQVGGTVEGERIEPIDVPTCDVSPARDCPVCERCAVCQPCRACEPCEERYCPPSESTRVAWQEPTASSARPELFGDLAFSVRYGRLPVVDSRGGAASESVSFVGVHAGAGVEAPLSAAVGLGLHLGADVGVGTSHARGFTDFGLTVGFEVGLMLDFLSSEQRRAFAIISMFAVDLAAGAGPSAGVGPGLRLVIGGGSGLFISVDGRYVGGVAVPGDGGSVGFCFGGSGL